ncbi:MAG: hypothetical protein P8Y68_15325 [Anaerolineales bacterium]
MLNEREVNHLLVNSSDEIALLPGRMTEHTIMTRSEGIYKKLA